MLAENPWNGGAGYTLEQIGQMTLDQIWFRLCDKDILKRPVGGRIKTMHSLQAVGQVKQTSDGLLAGRAADGTLIRGRIAGKSKARQLMEDAEKAKQAESKRRKRGK